MTDNEKKEAIRSQRHLRFKCFDDKAIQCLSQGIDIPADWLTYATELRTLTDNIANTTRITEGQLDIIWPTKPE